MATEKQELAALFREYHEAKIKADRVKILSAKIKDKIRDLGPEGASAGGFHASVSPVKGRLKINEARLKAEKPEIWQMYAELTNDTERLNFR